MWSWPVDVRYISPPDCDARRSRTRLGGYCCRRRASTGTRPEAGCAPAEEAFEGTGAFDWLQRHAARYGFRLSYPRGNPHGIVYEPWHWRFAG